MAHLRCDFFSEVLRLSTTMTVILPQQTSTQIGMAGREREGAPQVLYLLHGLSDDDTIWLRRASIERFVAPLGLTVIIRTCPGGTDDTLYADSVRFVQACASAGIPVTTSFIEGEHEWGLWDQQIQQVLAWLPL